MSREPHTPENTTVTVDELKRYANLLSATSRVFVELAKWFEENDVGSFRSAGFPSARTGVNNLGNFIANVLKAYNSALLDKDSAGVEPATVLAGHQARETARRMASGRDTATEISAALSGVEQAEAKVIARRKKSAKKAAKKTGVT